MSSEKTWHSVKVAMPLIKLGPVRRWLVENCGRRWHATNYKNQPLDWRQIGQMSRSKTEDLWSHMDYTTLFHFNKVDDMMLFLLVWPGEVLIKDLNECIINNGSDK